MVNKLLLLNYFLQSWKTFNAEYKTAYDFIYI